MTSKYKLSSTLNPNKVFLIKSSELEGRLDPFYYSPLNKLLIIEQTKLPKKKLSEVADLKRGKFSYRPRNDPRFYDGQYPFIQTGDIVKASKALGKIEYTQTLNELGLSVSKLFVEEVLLITIAANIGDTAILDYPACFPDSLVAITSKDINVSLKYLNVYFKFLKKYLENLAPQAAQKNLTLEQLAPTPIIIPTNKNQDKIVSIYDSYLEQKRQNEAHAEKLLASIDDYLLKELGITLPKQSENTLKSRMFKASLKEISGSRFDPLWLLYLKNINNSKYPETPLKNLLLENPQYGANEIGIDRIDSSQPRYIRITDINDIGDLSDELGKTANLIEDKYFLNNKDLLFARSGNTVGKSYLHKERDSTCFFAGYMIRFKINPEKALPEYIFTFTQSSIYKMWIKAIQRTTGQPNINSEEYRSLLIPLPPLAKQKEISERITSIRQEAQKLKDKTKEAIEKANKEMEKILLG